jgi:hypothetical protein
MEHDKKLKINLITPPDKLDNYNLTFTLVYPTDDTKSQLQNLIENFDKDLNVYMYEQSDSEATINWLLDIVHRSDYVILDIDNFAPKHIDIISYLLGHSNVYWLTKGENVVYNILSKNRIYNLDWLYNSIGEKLETTQ